MEKSSSMKEIFLFEIFNRSIDFSELYNFELQNKQPNQDIDVLNGIAYDKNNDG